MEGRLEKNAKFKKKELAWPPAIKFLLTLIDILNAPTMNEWIHLKSTLVSTFNTRFLCSTCLEKYPTQPDRLERERNAKGCRNEFTTPIHHENGIQYLKCPGNFYSEGAATWIEYYNQFENGILPHCGGYFDQPAKAIQVLRIIQSYKVNWDLERAKQQTAKQQSRINHGR